MKLIAFAALALASAPAWGQVVAPPADTTLSIIKEIGQIATPILLALIAVWQFKIGRQQDKQATGIAAIGVQAVKAVEVAQKTETAMNSNLSRWEAKQEKVLVEAVAKALAEGIQTGRIQAKAEAAPVPAAPAMPVPVTVVPADDPLPVTVETKP